VPLFFDPDCSGWSLTRMTLTDLPPQTEMPTRVKTDMSTYYLVSPKVSIGIRLYDTEMEWLPCGQGVGLQLARPPWL